MKNEIYSTEDYYVIQETRTRKERGKTWGPGLYAFHNNDSTPKNVFRPYADEAKAIAACDELQAQWDVERAAIRAEIAAEEKAEEERRQLIAEKGPLATPRQVSYIMALIDQGARLEGGFYYGPTTREEVEKMSKKEASLYITSLKGDY